jgi:hypothetical protein
MTAGFRPVAAVAIVALALSTVFFWARSEKEFRVGDRWLAFVKRNGQVGTILDGKFMPVADARAKLESRASSRHQTGK